MAHPANIRKENDRRNPSQYQLKTDRQMIDIPSPSSVQKQQNKDNQTMLKVDIADIRRKKKQ